MIISSVTYTEIQESRATVVRLLSLSARIHATPNPTQADTTLDVAVKIAGMVIAVSTA